MHSVGTPPGGGDTQMDAIHCGGIQGESRQKVHVKSIHNTVEGACAVTGGGGEEGHGAGDRCAPSKPIHNAVDGACTMTGRDGGGGEIDMGQATGAHRESPSTRPLHDDGEKMDSRGPGGRCQWKHLEAKDTHPNHCHEQLVHPRGVAAVGKPGCKAHGHQTAQLPLQRRALPEG
jgi:hypothetical protein